MRTTIDLPDPLFREVKATAAREGVLLKEFVTDALRMKLASPSAGSEQIEKPWMKFSGGLGKDPEMAAELERVMTVVDEEFRRVDPEDWK